MSCERLTIMHPLYRCRVCVQYKELTNDAGQGSMVLAARPPLVRHWLPTPV